MKKNCILYASKASKSGLSLNEDIIKRSIDSVSQLVLVAADHGSPTYYETLRLLTILLVDTNDNVPEFNDEYNFHVPENRPKDYVVGKVTAEDKDEGRHARVYYYIEAGENYGNSKNKVMRTACTFEFMIFHFLLDFHGNRNAF